MLDQNSGNLLEGFDVPKLLSDLMENPQALRDGLEMFNNWASAIQKQIILKVMPQLIKITASSETTEEIICPLDIQENPQKVNNDQLILLSNTIDPVLKISLNNAAKKKEENKILKKEYELQNETSGKFKVENANEGTFKLDASMIEILKKAKWTSNYIEVLSHEVKGRIKRKEKGERQSPLDEETKKAITLLKSKRLIVSEIAKLLHVSDHDVRQFWKKHKKVIKSQDFTCAEEQLRDALKDQKWKECDIKKFLKSTEFRFKRIKDIAEGKEAQKNQPLDDLTKKVIRILTSKDMSMATISKLLGVTSSTVHIFKKNKTEIESQDFTCTEEQLRDALKDQKWKECDIKKFLKSTEFRFKRIKDIAEGKEAQKNQPLDDLTKEVIRILTSKDMSLETISNLLSVNYSTVHRHSKTMSKSKENAIIETIKIGDSSPRDLELVGESQSLNLNRRDYSEEDQIFLGASPYGRDYSEEDQIFLGGISHHSILTVVTIIKKTKYFLGQARRLSRKCRNKFAV